MLKSKGIAPNGLIVPDDAAPITEPEPGLKRQVLAHSPAMMLVRHQMRQGWCGSAHAHPHEQMVYVVSGRIRITAEARSTRRRCGQQLHRQIKHSASGDGA